MAEKDRFSSERITVENVSNGHCPSLPRKKAPISKVEAAIKMQALDALASSTNLINFVMVILAQLN